MSKKTKTLLQSINSDSNNAENLLFDISKPEGVSTADVMVLATTPVKNKGGRPRTRENMIKVSYKINAELQEQVKNISKKTGKSIQIMVTDAIKNWMDTDEQLINDFADIDGVRKSTGIYLDIDFKDEFQSFCINKGVTQVFVFESIYSKLVRESKF